MPRGQGSAQLIFGGKALRTEENARREDYFTTLINKGKLEKAIEEFTTYDENRRRAVFTGGWGGLLCQRVIEREENLIKEYLDKLNNHLDLKESDKAWQAVHYKISSIITQEFKRKVFRPSGLDSHKFDAAAVALSNYYKATYDPISASPLVVALREEIGDYVRITDKYGSTEEVRWPQMANKEGSNFYLSFFKAFFYELDASPELGAKDACSRAIGSTCWLYGKNLEF